jgi:hypothetical protein
MQDAELADSEPGDAGVDTGTVDGSPPPARMSAPSYSGSTWTAASLTNDETFSNLDNWNYGYTDYNASGGSGAYSPWGASGTAPYWGSSGAGDGSLLDYDLPGNVFQTSTGADTFLYSTYGPQTFNPHGSGVSLVAHYTGARQWNTEGSGELSATWTSGVINSYNKISFPSGAHTSCFVQINAQMMGNAGSDNGAWNTLAFLGQESEGREIALQGTGLTSQSPNIITSSLQSPNLLLDSYTSASDLSTGYHIYGMELADETVTIYLDNVQVGTASSGTSGPYFLLMDGAIASGTYGAAPANNVDMTMNIAEVQVYQK